MRRLAPSFVLALAVTTWACSGYVADTSVAPGDTVRVTAPDLGIEKQQATFQALRGDTLAVTADSAMALSLSSVTRLDVFGGRRSNPGRGAAIGAAVGVTAGFITGLALGGGCSDSACISDAGAGVIVAVVFGAGGALLGVVTGAFIKTDRWEEVPLDEIRIGLSPFASDGVAVSVSLRL